MLIVMEYPESKLDLYSAQIWPVLARGSHNFTCHPHMNHTCHISAVEHHHHLAGTHCAYSRRDGQAEMTWVAG